MERARLKSVEVSQDGHAVEFWERRRADGSFDAWVEITERFGPRCDFAGTLVLHGGAAEFVARSRRVRVTPAAVANGSGKTRELGLPVASLTLTGRTGSWIISTTPTLMVEDFSLRPTWHTFAEVVGATMFEEMPVRRVRFARPARAGKTQVAGVGA